MEAPGSSQWSGCHDFLFVCFTILTLDSDLTGDNPLLACLKRKGD